MKYECDYVYDWILQKEQDKINKKLEISKKELIKH